MTSPQTALVTLMLFALVALGGCAPFSPTAASDRFHAAASPLDLPNCDTGMRDC